MCKFALSYGSWALMLREAGAQPPAKASPLEPQFLHAAVEPHEQVALEVLVAWPAAAVEPHEQVALEVLFVAWPAPRQGLALAGVGGATDNEEQTEAAAGHSHRLRRRRQRPIQHVQWAQTPGHSHRHLVAEVV